VAVYEDASSLRRVNWVSLDIVDASREIVSDVGSKLLVLGTWSEKRLTYVNCVFCAVRRILGAGRELMIKSSSGNQPCDS
jgi:hypothetical protein